jgi:hypothetical protein
MENLWPVDIVDVKLTAPVKILREQASKLGERSQNLVEAEIEHVTDEYWSENNNGFTYAFNIIGRLIDFKFNLFKIGHSVTLYPIFIKLDDDILKELKGKYKMTMYQAISVASESEFLEALKLIFSAVKTRKVIEAVLAQSES